MAGKSPSRSGDLVGSYEIVEKIGKGGMSDVYKGRDTRTDEIVAVKIASRIVANNPQLCRRFELEFSIAHPLSHRNLVKVLDHGIHEKVPYFVMEYVDGPSLATHIINRKSLREHEALSILLPVTDALAFLHNQKILHRDIKPDNILLGPQGQVKLADLGLVKDLGALHALTRTNVGVGTTHFVAPEQFDDAGSADFRSDIYSLAATLYTALTGAPPFARGTMTSVLKRKLENQFDAPISTVPDLRPGVDAVIRMALHADPKFRPQTVSEFVALLTGWKQYPANTEFPGQIGKPAALSKAAKKSADERRANTRYNLAVSGRCRAVGGKTTQHWDSTVTDISTTGLCLQVPRRFEPGSVLEIMFSVRPDESAVTQLARVRWSKAGDAKSWLLGCEFVNGMSDRDLEAILSDLLDQTNRH